MDKLPHILFIASWYPHDDNLTHGIFIRRHAECVEKNHKVTVVFAKSSATVVETSISINTVNNLTEIIVLYPKIRSSIPFLKEYLKFSNYNNAVYKAVQLAQQEQEIDIVHLQVIFPACIPTIQILQQLNKPLLITEHWTGYSPEDGSYNGIIKRYYTKKIISKAHTVVAISGYLKKIMQNCGLTANYEIIPNIVDTDVFYPDNTSSFFETEKTTKFIHISSLDDKQKNVSGIIQAFCAAFYDNPNIRLTIVGDGGDLIELKSLVKLKQIEKAVTFIGRLTKTDLATEINKHDALIMFSNYETFCLAIAENLACGKPVITTNVGGVGEYMKSDLGIIVPAHNVNDLKKAILNFVENKSNYNSTTIREFALKQFDKEIINKQFSELYQKVLLSKK